MAAPRARRMAGRIPGRVRGRGRGRDGRAVTDWKVTAGGMTRLGGRTFAELDRRRYPPGGRLSWLIIRGRRYRPGGRQSPIIPRDGAA